MSKIMKHDFRVSQIAHFSYTGDTYSTTLLYDYRARRFKITTWGDFYARSPEYRAARGRDQ